MGEVGGAEHREDGGHAEAVVGAEGGAFRADPVAVDAHADAFRGEVKDRVGVFLVHHVEVRLQDHRRAVFHAGRGGLRSGDVADRVAAGFEPEGAEGLLDVELDCFFPFRSAGNGV